MKTYLCLAFLLAPMAEAADMLHCANGDHRALETYELERFDQGKRWPGVGSDAELVQKLIERLAKIAPDLASRLRAQATSFASHSAQAPGQSAEPRWIPQNCERRPVIWPTPDGSFAFSAVDYADLPNAQKAVAWFSALLAQNVPAARAEKRSPSRLVRLLVRQDEPIRGLVRAELVKLLGYYELPFANGDVAFIFDDAKYPDVSDRSTIFACGYAINNGPREMDCERTGRDRASMRVEGDEERIWYAVGRQVYSVPPRELGFPADVSAMRRRGLLLTVQLNHPRTFHFGPLRVTCEANRDIYLVAKRAEAPRDTFARAELSSCSAVGPMSVDFLGKTFEVQAQHETSYGGGYEVRVLSGTKGSLRVGRWQFDLGRIAVISLQDGLLTLTLDGEFKVPGTTCTLRNFVMTEKEVSGRTVSACRLATPGGNEVRLNADTILRAHPETAVPISAFNEYYGLTFRLAGASIKTYHAQFDARGHVRQIRLNGVYETPVRYFDLQDKKWVSARGSIAENGVDTLCVNVRYGRLERALYSSDCFAEEP